jgi:pimeloyl-ACP methyl ester carboxylesterase
VIGALYLKDAVLVGHSAGGGEVVRYIGRHGKERVSKAILIAAVPPVMLKTPANPEGLPMEVFDKLRSDLTKDHSQFYKDLAILVFRFVYQSITKESGKSTGLGLSHRIITQTRDSFSFYFFTKKFCRLPKN